MSRLKDLYLDNSDELHNDLLDEDFDKISEEEYEDLLKEVGVL